MNRSVLLKLLGAFAPVVIPTLPIASPLQEAAGVSLPELMGQTPRYLVVSPKLYEIAQEILGGEYVTQNYTVGEWFVLP